MTTWLRPLSCLLLCAAVSCSAPPTGLPGGDACSQGEVQRTELVCGLNGDGYVGIVCQEGAWAGEATCVDGGECVEGQERNTLDPCGAGGIKVEACVQGTWVDAGACNETAECEQGTRIGPTSCGYNGRGTHAQTCTMGFWIDDPECVDPDMCLDGVTRLGVTACEGGYLEQVCAQGVWTDTDECVVEPGCVEGQALTVSNACGLNDRGSLELTCPGATWEQGACADPDVCLDGAHELDWRSSACDQRSPVHVASRTCERGAWTSGCEVAGVYLASVAGPGTQAPTDSRVLGVNRDGRLVLYENLADPGAWSGGLYLYDQASAQTTPVADRHTDAAICADGSVVVFADGASVTAYRPGPSVFEPLGISGVMGGPPDAPVSDLSLSEDGRLLVFESEATNLVAGDTNGVSDVFLHDLQTSRTTRLTVRADGEEFDEESSDPFISADGSSVVLVSRATDVVRDDNNQQPDVFHLDLGTGTWRAVTVDAFGRTAAGTGTLTRPVASRDGRFVAFASSSSGIVSPDQNGASDVFVRDMQQGDTVRVSADPRGRPGDLSSLRPSISESGRYVTFLSRATNLATNQPADGSIGVFVWDRLAGEATWLAPSVPVPTSSSTWGRARLSGDGGVVALDSLASDLVELDVNEARDVFWMPRVGGDASIVSRAFSGAPANLRVDASSVSETGRFIVFTTRANNLVPGDANGARDVFLHDTSSATTELISVGLGGGPASDASSFPSVSADGRYVVFESEADDLVDGDTNGVLDVFMRDTLQGVTIRVSVTASGSQLQAPSRVSAISADGRFVTFTSSAEDLVPGDTNGEADLFLYDVAARTQRLVPVDTRFGASMSRDGTRLAVSTEAGLVPEDTNGVRDVYVWDQGTGEVILASVSSAGELGTHASSAPSLSADGRVVAFASLADNLDPGDPLGVQDVFVRDLVQGTTRRVARPLTESILLEEVFDQYASTSPRVSADGRLVLFRSSEQLWVHDRGVDQTRPLQGTLPADPLVPRFIQGSGSLSSDGRFVVFASLLTLVTGATVGKDNLYVLPMSTQP